MKNRTILIIVLGLIGVYFCSCGEKYKYPFQNPAYSLEERVEDLVSRLTLEEKVAQMQNQSAAIERLGIPSYNWWNECLHGVGRSGHKVTVFPQAIALAATFDDNAMLKMGTIISTEARAIYNESFKNGLSGGIYQGLTFWTPNINIFRDPRWGRGQETYGEDPYLTSVLGKEMVKGLQGPDSVFLKTSACAKHFAVHSGPESGRHEFDVSVNNYDLWDTYLPAFHSLVTEAKVSSVMCAYNRLDGEPCCGNNRLMMDILRNKWHFAGYVTSDCGAIDDFYTNHKTHPDASSASADAVMNGTDLDCGNNSYKFLTEAVEKGLIEEKTIDTSVKRLFMTRFRLGMFDNHKQNPYNTIKFDTLECDGHKEHALKMARESIVLLKNKNRILPFSKDVKKILVVGPNADNEEVQLGNYNGFPSEVITPLQGLKSNPTVEVIYAKATDYTLPDEHQEEVALEAIQDADVVVFIGGITPRLEGENGDTDPGKNTQFKGFNGGDRTTIALPVVQTNFMKKVKARNMPLVFVCMSGSAIGFEWEADNADAILQAWYGGQSAGTAIADVLFGNYNPSGRLPVTFYKKDSDLPDFLDYSMEGRTYRYFDGEPLFPFGYGLSYTKFEYQWGKKPETQYSVNDVICCMAQVKNTGCFPGDEIAQVYVKYPEGHGLPLKELRNYERISAVPGQEIGIETAIPVNALAKWDDSAGGMVVPKGEYQIWVGGHSSDTKVSFTFTVN